MPTLPGRIFAACPALLSCSRGEASPLPEEVTSFLHPRLSSLDPFLLPNMAAAATRVLRAVDSRERIVLFGDYDVDGVTSLALLAEMIRSYGSTPELFLPLRMEEGYGMSPESVDSCWEQHGPSS